MLIPENYVEKWQNLPGNAWILLACLKILSPSYKTFTNAQGLIKFDLVGQIIAIGHYATFNSPIHNLTACPGEILLGDRNCWENTDVSNEFTVKSFSGLLRGRGLVHLGENILLYNELKKIPLKDLIVVETKYVLPKDYNGPQYAKRLLFIENSTHRILRVEMTYQNGKTDCGDFFYETGQTDQFLIWWKCKGHGPNKLNTSLL